MVDLHSHTNRSDGTLTPEQLIDLAVRSGLQALSITDHDTLDGYDVAAEVAGPAAGSTPGGPALDLVCGVELNTRFRNRPIHVLGYFLNGPPGNAFRQHLTGIQQNRRERNRRLVERLHDLGLEVKLEEAEQLGRGQTGRPHFAQVLVKRGYVANTREAFDRYLDEKAPGFIERRDPSLDDLLRWIREAGGISSWAHPSRFFRDSGHDVTACFEELQAKGLNAIEVYHTDHSQDETDRFLAAAQALDLAITGGSDFHGNPESPTRLNGLGLPMSLLEDLRLRNAALQTRQ